jgi:DNA-binding MarR family transcriptional regulator
MVFTGMNKLNKFKPVGEVKAGVTGKLLYLMLDELADGNDAIVIPQRKISDALQISKCAVSRNLRKLKEAGHIEIVPQYRADDGGRSANKYILK